MKTALRPGRMDWPHLLAGPAAGNKHKMSESSANAATPHPSDSSVVSHCVSVPRITQDSVETPDVAPSRSEYGWVERVIRTEGAGILRMLWRLLGREQDVLDAYQDCFCKLTVCQDRNDLVNVRAYAYRTAANIAIEIIRTRARQAAHRPAIAKEHGRGADDGSVDEQDNAQFLQLREAIGELPTHLRNVVVLRDLSRMPYKEVGKTLGIEPATARVYRRHAIVKLAELIGGREPE